MCKIKTSLCIPNRKSYFDSRTSIYESHRIFLKNKGRGGIGRSRKPDSEDDSVKHKTSRHVNYQTVNSVTMYVVNKTLLNSPRI